jgi:hypothetical protein
MQQTHVVCDYIGTRLFPILADLKILELGPCHGWWTQQLLKYSHDITVVENEKDLCVDLRAFFGNKIRVVEDDFHYAVMNLGEFDVCVMLGILYHSVSPVKLLEDVVNFCKPRFICIDKTYSSLDSPFWSIENSNERGSRQNPDRSSSIVFCFDRKIFEIALKNLGYELVDEITIDDTELVEMPDLYFKSNMIISMYRDITI